MKMIKINKIINVICFLFFMITVNNSFGQINEDDILLIKNIISPHLVLDIEKNKLSYKNEVLPLNEKQARVYIDELQKVIIIFSNNNTLYFFKNETNSFISNQFDLPNNTKILSAFKIGNRFFINLSEGKKNKIFEISYDVDILELVEGQMKDFKYFLLKEISLNNP